MKNLTMTLAAIALVSASFTTFAASNVQSAVSDNQNVMTVTASSSQDQNPMASSDQQSNKVVQRHMQRY
ncbi:multiple stress resistance protein BhsA [Rouxiella sp. Mn2063]|uniref:multiple stress resistance protein BhsA n=1 Tax=Rouxiella sp. Mn2063 TaxID=3395262 RepID=UPI003BC0994B